MKAVYFVATALVGVVMFWVGFQLRPVLDPWEQQEVAAVPEDESVEVQQTEQAAAELAAQGYLPLEELTVRIDDGDVQWFDGTMWHTVASMEELAKEDKFYVAQEDYLKFEEQLKQQWEDRRAEQESPEEQGETLMVGQKETPKPVEKPRPTKPAETASAETGSASVAPSEGGDNGGGSNPSGGNPGGGDSGNSGGGNPGGGGSGNSGGGNPSSGDSGNGGGNSSGGDSGNSGGNSGGADSGNSGGGNSGGNGGEVNPGGDGGNTGDSGSAGDSGNAGSDDSSGDTGDGENMEWSDDYL